MQRKIHSVMFFSSVDKPTICYVCFDYDLKQTYLDKFLREVQPNFPELSYITYNSIKSGAVTVSHKGITPDFLKVILYKSDIYVDKDYNYNPDNADLFSDVLDVLNSNKGSKIPASIKQVSNEIKSSTEVNFLFYHKKCVEYK